MKAPHWLILAIGLATVVLSWVLTENKAGELPLPQIIVTVGVLALKALGLFSDSIQTGMRQNAAKIAALAGPAALLLLLGCSSCQNGAPSPAVVAGTDLAVCIFDQYATAPACRPGGNTAICIAGIAAACGSDVAAVEKVLTAQKRAMVADGYVPRQGDASSP